jgi:cardiolipin synthase
MDVTLPIWALAALILLIAFLGVLIWSSRRTLVRQVTPVALEGIDELLPILAALTGEPITEGNRVDVLQDGEFFDALLADIELAEHSIHFESYVWWRGDVSYDFARRLAGRARDGVEVRVLLDAQGSRLMEKAVLEILEEGGCEVARFHPLRLRDIGKYNSRDHRKLAVIDGRVAYFMGHGIAKEWCDEKRGGDGWRDTAVRILGPGVASAQAVFLRSWLNVHGELAVDPRHFPELESAGDARLHIAVSDPVGTYSEVELLIKVAIATARETIQIQNPYFVPDDSVIDLLGEAVARGVDVRIVLPRVNDSRVVRHASHKFYGRLLRRGVRLWEYQPVFAHQKVMVVDGCWSQVGSTNFDSRSMQINREVNVSILDHGVAEELTAAFERDLEGSVEMTYRSWQSRNPLKRLGDNLAYLIREQL